MRRLSASAVIPILAVTTIAGVALTVAILAVPGFGFGFRAPELYTGIETAATVVAALAAYLMAGRYARTWKLRDLALVVAFAVLAVSNLAFLTVPLIAGEPAGSLSAWGASGARLIAALALAFAAVAPDVRLGAPRKAAGVAGVLTVGGLTMAALGSELIPSLPAGSELAAQGTDGAQVEGPAGFLVLQLTAALLFAVAAVGLARQARNGYDRLLAWVALASLLAALSRVHEFLFPVVSSDWVLSADLLRLAMYSALLLGTLAEIGAYQRQLGAVAALEERRRVARELHDGLAQELAFISMESRRLAAAGDSRSATDIADAAQRALDESRQAIAVLHQRRDGTFADELQEVAGRLAGRAGARLRLEFERDVDLAPDRRDPVLRIVREAISNGIRHGGASEVVLCVSNGDALRVLVRDNGCGFDPDAIDRKAGFGLTTMRERASALGGAVAIRSGIGQGTEIEVTIP